MQLDLDQIDLKSGVAKWYGLIKITKKNTFLSEILIKTFFFFRYDLVAESS